MICNVLGKYCAFLVKRSTVGFALGIAENFCAFAINSMSLLFV